jgi:hypothetical protein
LLVIQPYLNGGFGERTVRPTTALAAERSQRLAAGELTLDLTDVKLSQQDLATEVINVRAEVGFGRLHVLVAHNAVLRITTDLGAGHVVIDGREVASGIRQTDQLIDSPNGSVEIGRQTFALDLKIGGGEIAIDRALASN